MKKIILMVIGIMILMPVANAQIQMGAKQSLPTKIATIAMAWYDLYEYNGKYHLTLKSTNQFDEHYRLYLGNKEEAIATLNTFIEMCDTMGKDDSIEIDNGGGDKYFVFKYGKGLSFHQKGHGKAGFTYMYKMHFKKTLDVITKK